jgi:hypothetical protein
LLEFLTSLSSTTGLLIVYHFQANYFLCHCKWQNYLSYPNTCLKLIISFVVSGLALEKLSLPVCRIIGVWFIGRITGNSVT